MLRLLVTNDSQVDRVWNVEPLGDEVMLQPSDVLTIELDYPSELLIEIRLHEAGASVWPSIARETALPEDLKVNGRSIWP